MSFLHYTAFLFLAAIPLIILLYLLKLKRVRIEVPSIMLWQKSVEDLIANTPFQKLKTNIFMLLQILIALLLIVALARPILLERPMERRNIVILIDRSASMKSTDINGKMRIEKAKDLARNTIHNMRKDDNAMLVSFDLNASVVQGFSSDKRLLLGQLESIQPVDTVSNLRETFIIIASLYQKNRDIEVFLFSDGNISDLSDFTAELPDISYVKIGEDDFNAGFTQFSIRRNFESPLDFQVFASAKNFSDTRIDTSVELIVEDVSVDIKRISLEPGGEQPLIFTLTSPEQKRVKLVMDVDDLFVVDNSLYGVLPAFHKTRILLVTNGNYFLEKALQTNPLYSLTIQKPQDQQNTTGYHLVIFDGAYPATVPDTNAIYFNSLPPNNMVTVTGEQTNTFIIDTDRQHPIMNYTRLENIVIAKCKTMLIHEGIAALAETADSPIIALGEKDNLKSLVIGFDLYDTDFPLKASFPIFLNNAIQFVSGSYIDTEKGNLSTRDPIEIMVDDPQMAVSIRLPDNTTQKIDVDQSLKTRFTHTRNCGFYELLRGGERPVYYGINLLAAQESDIKPAETIDMGAQRIITATEIRRANIEISYYFIWAALGLLLLEWILYWRRMSL